MDTTIKNVDQTTLNDDNTPGNDHPHNPMPDPNNIFAENGPKP